MRTFTRKKNGASSRKAVFLLAVFLLAAFSSTARPANALDTVLVKPVENIKTQKTSSDCFGPGNFGLIESKSTEIVSADISGYASDVLMKSKEFRIEYSRDSKGKRFRSRESLLKYELIGIDEKKIEHGLRTETVYSYTGPDDFEGSVVTAKTLTEGPQRLDPESMLSFAD